MNGWCGSSFNVATQSTLLHCDLFKIMAHRSIFFAASALPTSGRNDYLNMEKFQSDRIASLQIDDFHSDPGQGRL